MFCSSLRVILMQQKCCNAPVFITVPHYNKCSVSCLIMCRSVRVDRPSGLQLLNRTLTDVLPFTNTVCG